MSLSLMQFDSFDLHRSDNNAENINNTQHILKLKGLYPGKYSTTKINEFKESLHSRRVQFGNLIQKDDWSLFLTCPGVCYKTTLNELDKLIKSEGIQVITSNNHNIDAIMLMTSNISFLLPIVKPASTCKRSCLFSRTSDFRNR